MKLINAKTGGQSQQIDMMNTMYPTRLTRLEGPQEFVISYQPSSTIYGYIMRGALVIDVGDGRRMNGAGYFSATSRVPGHLLSVEPMGDVLAVIIERAGYKGQVVTGAPVEESGRLVYIDNCSDSLLIYPPRLGDPSLNHLHFPPGIEQTYHIHPSLRMGMVIGGRGTSDVAGPNGVMIATPLNEGDAFCIEERELHRFRTGRDQSMDVIAFHPDGDWGPTDHNHTMLNRTYISKPGA
jgi:quercetin dioxygenase-like cupin family protein